MGTDNLLCKLFSDHPTKLTDNWITDCYARLHIRTQLKNSKYLQYDTTDIYLFRRSMPN